MPFHCNPHLVEVFYKFFGIFIKGEHMQYCHNIIRVNKQADSCQDSASQVSSTKDLHKITEIQQRSRAFSNNTTNWFHSFNYEMWLGETLQFLIIKILILINIFNDERLLSI